MAKYQTRAQKRLNARIKGYEETVARRSDNGKGFHRPGSMKKS